MERKLLWAVAALLSAFAVAGFFTLHGTQTLEFTGTQIEDLLYSGHHPLTTEGRLQNLVEEISIKSAAVTVGKGQVLAQIGLQGAMAAKQKFTMAFSLLNVPLLAGNMLYFEPEKINVESLFIGKKAAKAEEWENLLAAHAIGHLLKQRPAHNFESDVAGVILSASLKPPQTDRGLLIVTISIWRLSVWAFLGLACLLSSISIAWMLIRNPHVGLAVQKSGARHAH